MLLNLFARFKAAYFPDASLKLKTLNTIEMKIILD